MNCLADETWRTPGWSRWDDNFGSQAPIQARLHARETLRQAQIELAGFECYLNADRRPEIRVNARHRRAAFYYDIHRMSRFAFSTEAVMEELFRHHVASARIAETLATEMPSSLLLALNALYGFDEALVAREFLLWRHSLDATQVTLFDRRSRVCGASPTVNEMVAIDDA